MTDLKDWATLLLVIFIATLAMQTLSAFIQRFLKLDRTERETVLQDQIDTMQEKQKEYEEETKSLRSHIKLLVIQYDDLVVENSRLKIDNQNCQKEIFDLREQVKRITSQSQNESTPPMSAERVLVVCLANDNPGFALDLASLRAVRADTGMEVSNLREVSVDNLKKTLDRYRSRGSHIYLHLAIRTDKEGYQLGDKIVDASWLSSILDGVIVMLVAGSDSDSIGDFLGVVPYVVTMAGSVNHRDMTIFTKLFWTEIGRGIGPSLALKRAMDRSPVEIREAVQSHWERI